MQLPHYQAADMRCIGHSECPWHEACLLVICRVAYGWGTHDMTVIWCMTFITCNNFTCHLVALFMLSGLHNHGCWLLALKHAHCAEHCIYCVRCIKQAHRWSVGVGEIISDQVFILTTTLVIHLPPVLCNSELNNKAWNTTWPFLQHIYGKLGNH